MISLESVVEGERKGKLMGNFGNDRMGGGREFDEC